MKSVSKSITLTRPKVAPLRAPVRPKANLDIVKCVSRFY